MSTITFTKHNVSFVLQEKLLLKSFLTSILTQEKIHFKSISYIFCTDEFLLKLNQQYLNHDTLTDILTFELSNTPRPLIAEIYISIERIKENALNLNEPFLNELHRVMIHGILHLCGYSDHSIDERRMMRKKEDFYLNQL
ncbi:MAG: rRNA maturation RNase YbeY [Ginsengibacter sp.]